MDAVTKDEFNSGLVTAVQTGGKLSDADAWLLLENAGKGDGRIREIAAYVVGYDRLMLNYAAGAPVDNGWLTLNSFLPRDRSEWNLFQRDMRVMVREQFATAMNKHGFSFDDLDVIIRSE